MVHYNVRRPERIAAEPSMIAGIRLKRMNLPHPGGAPNRIIAKVSANIQEVGFRVE